ETTASYEVISKPTANFSYSPQKVTLGESVTLNKVTTNAVKCINKWGTNIGTSTPYVFEPKQAGQFTDTYTCQNELGYQVETTASYEVISKPTANFSYSPQKVTLGESITLNKVTTNAATCTDKSGNSISISAPYVFEPKQTGQFTNTFTCQNELGYQVETTASFEVTPPPAPSLKKVSIKLNHTSLFERAFSINPVDPIEVFDEQIKLNMGVTLQFSFKINNDSNAKCKLTNTDNHFSEDLNYDAQGEFTTEITPAYFNERFDLKCADQSSNQFMTIANIVLKSIDNDILKKLANHVLDDKKGDYPKNEFPDEYAEYRLWNTYAQLHNLTDKAFLYANLDFVFNDICKFSGQPNMCEGEPEKVRIKNKLAEYLINTSEAFFETCPHPDNDLPIKHVDGNEYRPQCRLKEKAQGYFQWRSPYITVAQEVGKKDKEGQVTAEPSKLTSKHWHMEWRAAGNVAQAIKPFFDLTDNSFDFTSSCPSEELELPSEYKQIVAAQSFLSEEQKYACRANNVKRLLKKHIWDKWLDPNYETRKQYRINGTPMPHFIARTQMIEDLFIHTDDNYTQISRNHIIKDSIREDENSELSNIVCSATDETKCNWPKPVAWKDEKGEKKSVTYNYPFGTAGSMDLNHGEETILVITQSDALKYCEFKNGVENCFNKRFLAEQLNAKAWIKAKPEANSKGRFDYFLNGYCKGKTKNPINEQPENYLAHHKAFEGLDDINKMQYFCSVHNAAPKPASVVGWVRLAKYNRDLMINMRSVALEEKALVQTYQTLLNNESF
ncbi:hypothetical protein, partial [Pseudoalteromonas sp. P1-9]|uniref:hypothetical protein n=1 Tax=Pseudoalteromonas sp. P1-9 TaxID=1710354 RepID=UPI000ADAB930